MIIRLNSKDNIARLRMWISKFLDLLIKIKLYILHSDEVCNSFVPSKIVGLQMQLWNEVVMCSKQNTILYRLLLLTKDSNKMCITGRALLNNYVDKYIYILIDSNDKCYLAANNARYI